MLLGNKDLSAELPPSNVSRNANVTDVKSSGAVQSFELPS